MVTSDLQEHAGLDSALILAQLDLLLASQHFRNSARYPALLRFLVEQTLSGNAGRLKERLIGMEVFHRAPDYDTNAEPVVRVTAAEVRKRIAQYYHEAEHNAELRIELPIGTYVPRFAPAVAPRAPATAEPATAEEPAPAPDFTASQPPAEPERDAAPALVPAQIPSQAPSRTPSRAITALSLAAMLVLGALLTLGGLWLRTALQARQQHALHQFWEPFAGDAQPLLVVIGNHSTDNSGHSVSVDAPSTDVGDQIVRQFNHTGQVTTTDTLSLLRITASITRQQLPFRAMGANAANLDDLRAGPVLLFAGLDNRWTIRLTQPLRFRFKMSGDDRVGVIEDAKSPAEHWSVNFDVPYRKLTEDFAIVARYNDPTLERPVMIAAGIGETGSAAASEFITEEHFLEEAAALAPKDWKGHNMELVLRTGVVDGRPGAAHIVAAEFW